MTPAVENRSPSPSFPGQAAGFVFVGERTYPHVDGIGKLLGIVWASRADTNISPTCAFEPCVFKTNVSTLTAWIGRALILCF
jgi:hypothetical protein